MEESTEVPTTPFSSPHSFNPLMIATVGIVAAVLILTFYHLILSKFCISRSHIPTTQHDYYTRDAASRGVNEKVLSAIPVEAYKTLLGGTNQCECAVCLGELEDDDPVRVLPNCQHVFHLQCIDKWFTSHCNCPLCRSPVVGPPSQGFSVVVLDANGLETDRLLNESQVVISIDDEGTRTSPKISLGYCSSVLMSVERKQQLLAGQFKRSVSDCTSVSTNRYLERENKPALSSRRWGSLC